MKDPRPFFPFYVADFWRAEEVQTMTMEAVGLYLAMLSHQWEHGSCPGNAAALHRLFGSRCSAWDDSLAQVLVCFESDGDRLQNSRIERERTKADRFSDKQRGKAKSMWKARKERRKADITGSSHGSATAMPRHQSGSASAYAAAMPIDIGHGTLDTGQKEDATHPPAGKPPEPAKKPRKEPTGPQADGIRWWCERWFQTRGSEYQPARKDFVAVAAMLKKGPLDEVMRRMDRMLTDPDPFVFKNASPTWLESRWNQYGVTAPPPRQGPSVSDYETVRAPR